MLEEDFARFDSHGDGFVDLFAVTKALPHRLKASKVGPLSVPHTHTQAYTPLQLGGRQRKPVRRLGQEPSSCLPANAKRLQRHSDAATQRRPAARCRGLARPLVTVQVVLWRMLLLTPATQVDILQRLFPLVRQVDRDGSMTLSFFEFCYLAFKMSLGGGYKDMCADSRDAGFVKRHMLVIGRALRVRA